MSEQKIPAISKAEHMKAVEKWTEIIHETKGNKKFIEYGFLGGVRVWSPCSYCEHIHKYDASLDKCVLCTLNRMQTQKHNSNEKIPICMGSTDIDSAAGIFVLLMRENKRTEALYYAEAVLEALNKIGAELGYND